FIQDAHDSLEAQENIAKIIDHLVANYGIKTVFEEGYQGPVPTDDYFGAIADPAVKERVSYFLMDKLRIGGAEYAHINRTHDFELIGADSLKLHLENIKRYKESAQRQKEIEKDLKALEKHIRRLSDKYFPKALKKWLKEKRRYSEGKIDLPEYLTRLGTVSKSAGFEGKLLLNPALLETVPKAFDPKAILRDISAFETQLAQVLLGAGSERDPSLVDRDKKLLEIHQALQLLKRLNRIEITADEFEVLKTDPSLEGLSPLLETQSLAEFIARHDGKSIVLSKRWEQNIRHAVRFYEIAQARDRVVEKTLLGTVSVHQSVIPRLDRGIHSLDSPVKPGNDKVVGTVPVVLVFGGFHKEGIKEILRRNGFSYVIVSPKMIEISKKHRQYYTRLMELGSDRFQVSPLLTKAARALSDLVIASQSLEAQTLVRSEIRSLADIVINLQQKESRPSIESMDLAWKNRKAVPVPVQRSEAREADFIAAAVKRSQVSAYRTIQLSFQNVMGRYFNEGEIKEAVAQGKVIVLQFVEVPQVINSYRKATDLLLRFTQYIARTSHPAPLVQAELETGIFEMLKNALYNGNQYDFKKPILIHIDHSEKGEIQAVRVFDTGTSETAGDSIRNAVNFEALTGRGLGEKTLRKLSLWDYQRQSLAEYGGEASLERRDINSKPRSEARYEMDEQSLVLHELGKPDQPRRFRNVRFLETSRRLELAVDSASGRQYVIKRLINEKDQEKTEEAIGILNRHRNFLDRIDPDKGHFPYIYDPEMMSAGRNQWAGLEEAMAVVYPHETGVSFKRWVNELKKQPLDQIVSRYLNILIKIARVAALLEEAGLPGVWDFNPSNIVIRPSDQVHLIDYEEMNVDPIASLEWLLYFSYQSPELPNTAKIIPTLTFLKNPEDNAKILEALEKIHRRVEQRSYPSINGFVEDLIRVRGLIRKHTPSRNGHKMMRVRDAFPLLQQLIADRYQTLRDAGEPRPLLVLMTGSDGSGKSDFLRYHTLERSGQLTLITEDDFSAAEVRGKSFDALKKEIETAEGLVTVLEIDRAKDFEKHTGLRPDIRIRFMVDDETREHNLRNRMQRRNFTEDQIRIELQNTFLGYNTAARFPLSEYDLIMDNSIVFGRPGEWEIYDFLKQIPEVRSESRPATDVAGTRKRSETGRSEARADEPNGNDLLMQQTLEKLIQDVVPERVKVHEIIRGWDDAIGVMGSARIEPGHPYYEQGIRLGKELFKKRVAPRTGAGPGIMEAVLAGYQRAKRYYLLRRFTYSGFSLAAGASLFILGPPVL
ncbi:hypothetical protein N9K06_01790, partial [Omnitrophica bacterium]|nr:hypothetical protein [Candidatus Omnitrophota bacterium]